MEKHHFLFTFFQITVLSPSQALVNGHQGASQLAMVVLEAEESASSHCSPVDLSVSTPPFTCVVAFLPPIPEVDMNDVLAASSTYIPEKGNLNYFSYDMCVRDVAETVCTVTLHLILNFSFFYIIYRLCM